MSAKSTQLQIRISPEQKARLRRLARRAGQGMSDYVLARALPPAQLRFAEVLDALRAEGERRFALAELNDLLSRLAPAELREAVADADLRGLSPYVRNYVAAMVEQAAHDKGIAPPGWCRTVEPLAEPRFATPLPGLRIHLLRSAPVPFKRRNIFVDSTLGDRV